MKYIYLFFGIVAFIIFGLDIQYDRDFMTWMWLLGSVINLMTFLALFIVEEIKKK